MTVGGHMTKHQRHQWGTLLLRVTLGVIFVMHGWYAWRQIGVSGVAELVASLGYPPSPLLAWYLILAQLLGGLCLVVGLWTSIAALLQVPILASAVFLFNRPSGFLMDGIVGVPDSGRSSAAGLEFPLLVLVSTLALALLGSGAFSVDHFRAGKAERLEMP